jgi:archaellum component FlaC
MHQIEREEITKMVKALGKAAGKAKYDRQPETAKETRKHLQSKHTKRSAATRLDDIDKRLQALEEQIRSLEKMIGTVTATTNSTHTRTLR